MQCCIETYMWKSSFLCNFSPFETSSTHQISTWIILIIQWKSIFLFYCKGLKIFYCLWRNHIYKGWKLFKIWRNASLLKYNNTFWFVNVYFLIYLIISFALQLLIQTAVTLLLCFLCLESADGLLYWLSWW